MHCNSLYTALQSTKPCNRFQSRFSWWFIQRENHIGKINLTVRGFTSPCLSSVKPMYFDQPNWSKYHRRLPTFVSIIRKSYSLSISESSMGLHPSIPTFHPLSIQHLSIPPFRPRWQRMPSSHVFYHRSPAHSNSYVLRSFSQKSLETNNLYYFQFCILLWQREWGLSVCHVSTIHLLQT